VIGAYDQIIKLTYKHFLCKQGSVYTLYHSTDEPFLVPGVQMTLEEEPTLEKVVEKITAVDLRVSKELSAYLRKVPGRQAYISLYRQYKTSFYDFINHFAYGRVMIDEHYHITPLDLE
jgi:virulence-associated protein VapD